ncbi:MAG TPA: PhzF family phenazine biosynthesis protein [Coriobacteriia bacterium]|nr:PhzF family phenazine biosynthesis protein [Coriobacteriia bacterium]
MRTYRFLIVDVFTDRPLAGNQLGVFTNAVGLSDDEMLSLARELDFSETAFILPAESGGDFRLRIFTPARELPFAGHPTLGAAFAMAGPLQSTLIRIETPGGIVPVMMEREGAKLVFGRMEQPIPTVEAWRDAEQLLDALGVAGSQLPIEVYDNGVRHVFVMLPSFAEVAALRPDTARLAAVARDTGVNVFAADCTQVKTRMFWTDLGVGEDAATGSAAGPLALHMARHGRLAWGEELEISQGAEIGRPSTLYARAIGNADSIERVEVGGSAVVVARGEFGL